MKECKECWWTNEVYTYDIWGQFWNWTVRLCDSCADIDYVQDKYF